MALAESLGFIIGLAPLGPRGGMRTVIVGRYPQHLRALMGRIAAIRHGRSADRRLLPTIEALADGTLERLAGELDAQTAKTAVVLIDEGMAPCDAIRAA